MKKIYLLFLAVFSVSAVFAQPANDAACNPTMLTIGDDCSGTLPYTNVGATAELGEKSGECYGEGSVEQTVWFAFVAPASGAVSIETDFANSGLQDNQLTVFNLEGGDCTVTANFIEIACNEDKLPATVNSEFNGAIPPFPVNPGTTYYVQVDGFTDAEGVTSEGSFCIVVTEEAPPGNDDCANAEVYGGFGPSCTKVFEGTTIDATAGNGIDVFSCDGSPFNASVYYALNSGVAEIEFNLITGENINVSLLTASETCDAGGSAGSIEVTGNCFTGINASPGEEGNAMNTQSEVLFTSLTPMTSYLLAVWTDEGEETDFSFCLTRARNYSCGDGECFDLAENYTSCPSDCPCVSDIQFFNFAVGEDSGDVPYGVCPEIANGTTDENNPGLFVPFTVNTLDNDLNGSLVSTTVGTLFTSTTPPEPLPDNEATNFLKYLFLTEAEIAAGGSVTVSFTSDDNACSAEVTFDMSELVANSPATGDCGGCEAIITADYSMVMCDVANGTVNTPVSVENGVGPNIWFGLDGNTTFNPDEDNFPLSLTEPAVIPFGDSDGTFTIYDSGKPNCAYRVTFFTGDFNCSPTAECVVDGGISTNCRLSSEPITGDAACNEQGTVNVPVNIGRVTGTASFTPDGIISQAEDGTLTATIDPANCEPINFTVSDESTCDQTPIVTINSPEAVAGGITVSTNADDWGVQIPTELGTCNTDSALVGTLAVLNDGNTAGGQLTDFCEPLPPEIPDASVCAQISGKIAMIDRGQCFFSQKVENAQNCGAIGVIICNCQPGPAWCSAEADELLTMAAGNIEGEITIPAVFMLFSDCQELKAQMDLGLDVEACIGAPETIIGCQREFTLDVCDDVAAVAPCGTPGCTDPNACNFDGLATIDDGSCQLPPAEPTDLLCYQTATLNNDPAVCDWEITGDQPTEPETLCYETATFNETSCQWEVTGDPPVEPATECYETATFNDGTCMWDVAGDPPVEPTDLACYETATFDEASCAWVVEGDQPEAPMDLACYQMATFNDATCVWDVTGEQDPEPDTACYETATFNDATCMWDVTGEQDPEPTTACYETATFDDTACEWVVDGVQPEQPTDLACYQEVGAFDDATCEWQILGEQPPIDDGCDLTEDSFDDATCMAVNTSTCPDNTSLDEVNCVCVDDVIPGCTDECASNYDPMANSDDGSCILPDEPATACYETATFNAETCMWDISGEQPEAPTTECYETAEFDDASCSWTVSGERDPEPTGLACYETASFDDASCAWVVEGEAPVIDDNCDLTEDSLDEATCMAVNTPDCPAGTSFNADDCVCTDDPIPGCTDDTACNYDPNATEDDGSCEFLPDEPTDLACYEEATANLATCSWDVTGEQPEIDDNCDVTVDTFDDATCMAVNTPDCPDGTSFNAAACSCDSDLTCEDPCAPNFGAGEACEDYITDCNQDCAAGPFGGTWDAASCSCVDEVTPVNGCTDSTATNFDSAANCDDGSCMFVNDVMGCTDMDACNYDAAANTDDGSCIYAIAGSISTTSSTSICVDDDVDEPIDVSVDDAGQGNNGAWVITDDNAIILALPAEPPFVLDGAGEGTCLIWWVNFSDDTFAPAVGDDAAALVEASSCAALSNSIAVSRLVCGGAECTPPSAGDFNCDE